MDKNYIIFGSLKIGPQEIDYMSKKMQLHNQGVESVQINVHRAFVDMMSIGLGSIPMIFPMQTK